MDGMGEEQAAGASADPGAEPLTSVNSTGAAQAVEVPPALIVPDAAAAATESAASPSDMDDPQEGPCSSRTASPLNIHSLLNRPFGDVQREIISGFQLKSTAQVAAEQLRYLVFHRDHDRDLLGSQQLMGLMLQLVRESPGLASSGSCIFVLAHLARTPAGREQLRAQGVLAYVLRFLALPDVVHKANAEPALLLLQNLSCDRPVRHALLKAGGIPLLLGLLAANPLALKVEQPRVAAHLAGTLLNMVAGDGDSTAAKHMFVKAGGMEIGCKVLATWGRYDSSAATLRLRLLLTDLGKLQQYAVALHQTALDASLSARTHDATAGGAGSARAAGGAAAAAAVGSATGQNHAQLPGAGALEVAPQVLAMAGKGIPLGAARMPASERITAVVLEHGKSNHDVETSQLTGQEGKPALTAGVAAA